jgi:hypothetical protein
MKVKDAIIILKKRNIPLEWNPYVREVLLDAFLAEFTIRQKTRFGDRIVSLDAIISLTTEMTNWMKKLMIDYGFTEKDTDAFTAILYNTTLEIADKHRVTQNELQYSKMVNILNQNRRSN